MYLSRGWLQKDGAAAVRDFEAAIKFDPDNYEALAALGHSLAKSGSHAKAEKFAIEALLRGAHDYTGLFTIACIYGELGETDPENKDKHHRNAIALLRRTITM